MELTEIQKKLLAIAKPYDKEARKKAKERCKKLRTNYKLGYEKGYQDAVDKACEWLEENLLNYWSQINANDTDDFIKNFKKAMEE